MKTPGVTACLAFLLMVTGCTYDGIRAGQRRQCAAMPQSEAERCFRRTADTAADYKAKRAELERAVGTKDGQEAEEGVDPRFKDWIP